MLKDKALRKLGGGSLFPSNRQTLTAVVLLVAGVFFGGGGSAAGAPNLVVQLLSLIALAFHRHTFLDFIKHAPRMLVALVIVTVILPLLQCIPLPPVIWHELPGRNLAIESLALVGRQDAWMSFSVNIRRTFIAFLALVPPFTILMLSWSANSAERRVLLIFLVACGAIGIVLGTQQLAFENRELMFYAEAVGSQGLHGTFANRNTSGLFADVALCSLIGLMWRANCNPLHVGIGVGVGALLIVGLFLTQSRSSITLFIIPAAMLMIRMWAARRTWYGRRSPLIAFLLVLAVATTSLSFFIENARIQHSLARFDSLQDARLLIWQDTWSSIDRFWPAGSGIGTFDEVFQLDESLEKLGPGRAARAHNEYLETMLESGVLGPTLIGGWIVLIACWALRGIRGTADCGTRIAASAVFMLLALQSILDYPLRSQTLLCVAGLMLGILITRTSGDASSQAGMQ